MSELWSLQKGNLGSTTREVKQALSSKCACVCVCARVSMGAWECRWVYPWEVGGC